MYQLSGQQITWPLISLVIFMTIFLIAVIKVIRMDKKEVHHMENLPLVSQESEQTKENSHG